MLAEYDALPGLGNEALPRKEARSAFCAADMTSVATSHAIASTASPHHRYFQWKLTLDWFETYLNW
jgi:hypothetical protein